MNVIEYLFMNEFCNKKLKKRKINLKILICICDFVMNK